MCKVAQKINFTHETSNQSQHSKSHNFTSYWGYELQRNCSSTCGFDVTKNQVEYTVKKFCESNSIEEVILDKKRSGRLKSVRSPEVIRTVKQFIEVSTKISIEKYWTRDCINFMLMRDAVYACYWGWWWLFEWFFYACFLYIYRNSFNVSATNFFFFSLSGDFQNFLNLILTTFQKSSESNDISFESPNIDLSETEIKFGVTLF